MKSRECIQKVSELANSMGYGEMCMALRRVVKEHDAMRSALGEVKKAYFEAASFERAASDMERAANYALEVVEDDNT